MKNAFTWRESQGRFETKIWRDRKNRCARRCPALTTEWFWFVAGYLLKFYQPLVTRCAKAAATTKILQHTFQPLQRLDGISSLQLTFCTVLGGSCLASDSFLLFLVFVLVPLMHVNSSWSAYEQQSSPLKTGRERLLELRCGPGCISKVLPGETRQCGVHPEFLWVTWLVQECGAPREVQISKTVYRCCLCPKQGLQSCFPFYVSFWNQRFSGACKAPRDCEPESC